MNQMDTMNNIRTRGKAPCDTQSVRFAYAKQEQTEGCGNRASTIVRAAPSTAKKRGRAPMIDLRRLSSDTRQLPVGMLLEADEEVSVELARERAAEPIKSMEDITRISAYLIENKRYRDNMLFICGINFGLRVGDLRLLRFSHLIHENMCFKNSFSIWEGKTRETRKKQQNRHIAISDAVVEAVALYLEHTPGCRLSDYLFRSQSNNGKTVNEPISRMSIDRILKDIKQKTGLAVEHFSSHSLRKTFGYFMMLLSNNDPRKLLLLRKILGHSTESQTLDYIGITREEIREAYLSLNLGACKHYLPDDVPHAA